MYRDRRGQEEIVGFVAIVVIVAVIFVIFLGITLQKGKTPAVKESKEVEQFLQSVMVVTSSCAPSYVPAYDSLGALVRDCSLGKQCTSGRKTCDVLGEEMQKNVGAAWALGVRGVTGYVFNISASTNGTQNTEDIISFMNGSCLGSFTSAEYLTPAQQGSIVSTLTLCTG